MKPYQDFIRTRGESWFITVSCSRPRRTPATSGSSSCTATAALGVDAGATAGYFGASGQEVVVGDSRSIASSRSHPYLVVVVLGVIIIIVQGFAEQLVLDN